MRFTLATALSLALSFEAVAAIHGQNSIQNIVLNAKTKPALLARSTAIAILDGENGGNIEENTPDFLKLWVDESAGNLCKGEPFYNEPSLSYACSGFLVGPDLIATAGHCMVNVGESRNETKLYCAAYSWLFDYQFDSRGHLETEKVPKKNLYKCKQVIYAINESEFPFRDFALVQLDRPVEGRAPFKLSIDKLPLKTKLSTIGYPLGTPAKFSSGAHLLLNNESRPSFITNLDGFEGNSGSVVLNDNDEAVGIFVGGVPNISLVEDKAKSCERVNRCNDKGLNCTRNENGRQYPNFQAYGIEVTRIQYIIDKIEEFEKTRAK